MSDMNIFMMGGFAGHDRSPRYSTTVHTELKSTTFSFLGSTYCVHCGDPAKAIQANIQTLNCYKTTGHRCTCEGALDEMAERLAYELGSFSRCSLIDKPETKKPNTFMLKKLVEKRERVRLSDFERPSTITEGCASRRFITSQRTEIKYNLHHERCKDYPFTKFMHRVKEHYEAYQTALDSAIASLKETSVNEFQKVFDPVKAREL
tara:strand:- start:77293 stop:77910 length:618 start_codon:yes stop_codon:yes gene_type:complete